MNGQWPGMKQREDLGRGGYFGNVSCEQRKRVQLRSISGSQLSVWLEIAQMHGPAWSGMVRLGAEAILGQGSGGRLKGEVEGWTWDTAVNSSVL